MACGIFLDQGLNLSLLHWQKGSLPLSHQGSPNLGCSWEKSKELHLCLNIHRSLLPCWLERHKSLQQDQVGSLEANCQSFLLLMTVFPGWAGRELSCEQLGWAGWRAGDSNGGKRGLEWIITTKPNPPQQLIILLILKNHFGEIFASKYSRHTILLLGFLKSQECYNIKVYFNRLKYPFVFTSP